MKKSMTALLCAALNCSMFLGSAMNSVAGMAHVVWHSVYNAGGSVTVAAEACMRG